MTGYGQNTSSQFNPSQQPGTNFSTPNFVPPPHPQAASAFVNTHTSQLQQPGNPFIQQSSQQTNNQNTRQQQPFGMPYNQQSTPQNQYNRLPTPQNQYSQPSIQQSQNTQTTYLPPQRQSSQENNRAELSRFDRTSNQDVRVQAASFMASGGSQRDYPAANTNGNQMGNQMGNQPGYNNTGLMEASQPSGVGVIQMMGRNGEIPGQTRSQMSTSQSFGQQQGPQQYMVHNGLPPGNGQAIFGPYTNLSSANTIAQLAAVTPPVLMEAAASALPMAQIQGQHQRGASSGSGTAEMNLRGGEAPAEMSQMIKIEPGVEDVDMGGMVQGTPSVANSAANPIDVDALQLQVIQMQQEIARLRQSGQAGQGGQSGQPSQ